MTQEQIQFITANEIHFGLVLDHGQKFQQGHDITKRVLEIFTSLTGETADCCDDCIKEAYQKVWTEYQLNQNKPNGKREKSA